MNDLIKIDAAAIGGMTVQTVNARDLFVFLESRQDFSTWMKSRIEQYGFTEGQDFTLHKIMEQLPSGSKQKIDYHISIDMAKELAMVERNAKGKEARQYFIECERRVKTVDPMVALNDPATLRQALLGYTEKVLELEHRVEELAPKAEALDRLATVSEGSFCLTDAAKVLQVQPKRFTDRLQSIGWIHRRPMGSGWLAYMPRIKQGVLEHKVTTGEKSDGSEWVSTQVRVTAKGIAKLSEIFTSNGASA